MLITIDAKTAFERIQHTSVIKILKKPAHAFNPNTCEARAGGSLSSAARRAQLHRETVSGGKVLKKLEIDMSYLTVMKTIGTRTVINIVLNGERLKTGTR